MVNHSPVVFFLFSLFFYSHLNGAFDDAEHFPKGIEDRAKLLARADQCVLKYLEFTGKKLSHLPYTVKRCALSEYFTWEESGTFFPFQKCNNFVFFGGNSLQILNNTDFKMLNCKYLIIDSRENLRGLENYKKVDDLSKSQLNNALLQFKEENVIEHIFIFEMKEIENYLDNLLKIRKIYSLIVCQITIRVPTFVGEDVIWQFAENILRDDYYILLKITKEASYIEFYFFANNEYQCMMRYL